VRVGASGRAGASWGPRGAHREGGAGSQHSPPTLAHSVQSVARSQQAHAACTLIHAARPRAPPLPPPIALRTIQAGRAD
jgi:hypothetical protein